VRPAAPDEHRGAAPGASVRQRSLGLDFAVFRRPRTAEDAVPGAAATLPSASGRIYLSESRRIASSEGKVAWLAPADRGVCLVFAPFGGRDMSTLTCRTLPEVRSGRLFTVQPGPPAFVQGVAVDRVETVTATGDEPQPAHVIDNGYTFELWRRSALRLADRAGRTIGRVRLNGRMIGAPEDATAPPRAPRATTPPMLDG
jgi:hypothetical protein